MRVRPALAVLATGLAVTLGTTLGGAVSAAPGDGADRKAATKAATKAEKRAAKVARALDRIQSAPAGRVLARPTTPQEYPGDPRDIVYPEGAELHSTCDANLCVHWIEEGEHAADPAYAAEVFDVLTDVADQYVAAGFKRPLPDDGEEGGTQTDVYLGELDAVGALGFCRSDEGPAVGSAYVAFCGIDNDFESYGGWTGIRDVTIAHEYFHATQYAYDAEDAGWIYESTAAWIEDEVVDEVVDEVNDNVFFLNFGQLGDPAGYPFAGPSFPLDVLDDFGGFNTYGNWGFWRFLTERHPVEVAGIPTLVRDFFRLLDTTQGPNPTTARQALDAVLAARGDTTADAYAAFAAANQHPEDVYEEGATYPTAPDTWAPVQLGRKAPTASREATLDHLTSASGTATPFAGSKRLKVRVERGFAALRTLVTVHRADGTWSTVAVPVNKQGKGEVTVRFDAGVTSVEVTSAHGGTTDGQVAGVRFQAVG